MVVPRQGEQIKLTAAGSGFGIRGREDEPFDAGVDQSAGAHETGFEGHVESGAGQAVGVSSRRGATQGDHLGMSGGIDSRDRPIETLPERHPIPDDNRTDRDLTGGARLTGELQGSLHPVLIRGHSHSMVAGGFPEMS